MNQAAWTRVPSDTTVFLGPFADEEHSREVLQPMLACYGARIGGPDDADFGPELFQANVLTTSEGQWVEMQAGLAGHATFEATEYGFRVEARPDPEDEYGPAIGYSIHPIAAEGGVLRSGASIADHPAQGGDQETAGAKAELLVRGNTKTCEATAWVVELPDFLGDSELNLDLHHMLLSGIAGRDPEQDDATWARITGEFERIRREHPLPA